MMDWQLLNLGFGAVRLAIFAGLLGATLLVVRGLLRRFLKDMGVKTGKKKHRMINVLFLAAWLTPCAIFAIGTGSTYGPRVTLDAGRIQAPQTGELPPVGDLSPKVTKDRDRIQQMRDLTRQ